MSLQLDLTSTVTLMATSTATSVSRSAALADGSSKALTEVVSSSSVARSDAAPWCAEGKVSIKTGFPAWCVARPSLLAAS